MLIRPPPQVIRPSSVPGGRVAAQGFGFPHSPPHAPAITDTGGGGGGDTLTLDGMTLQLNSQDLILGA
jgi:hypothetical protein